MRLLSTFTLAATLALLAGCEPKSEITGPTVTQFSGKVVIDGKPVAIKSGDRVVLFLIDKMGQSYGIPVNADATFSVGKMPISKYSVQVRVDPAPVTSEKGSRAAPQRVTNVPAGFEIVEGQTEYTVELGKGFKL